MGVIPHESLKDLISLSGFIGSLHVGASAEEAMLRAGNTVVGDILAVLAGREPKVPLPR